MDYKKLIFSLVVILIILVVAVALGPETALLNLGEDELAYFNGDLFFNGDYMNIRNQFLSSLYDQAANINLFELFYCGSGLGETITDAELLAVMAELEMSISLGELPCPCEKISASNMDKVLTEYMNITLATTNGIGLDNFVYLSDYDAYYFFHGDTNYRSRISFSKGEREGLMVRLFYCDGFFADGNKMLTLQQNNGSYLFIANHMIDDAIGTD